MDYTIQIIQEEHAVICVMSLVAILVSERSYAGKKRPDEILLKIAS